MSDNVGKITWISGPVIIAKGLKNARMHEMVLIGHEELIGEILELERDVAHIQVYEETSGIKIGEPIIGTGSPLQVELGPGLMGNIFDGIQRPLVELANKYGIFIKKGAKADRLSRKKEWHFIPTVSVGEHVETGDIIGTVKETEVFTHKILVPYEIKGEVQEIVPEGKYNINEEIITLLLPNKKTKKLTMKQYWPVRRPRPFRKRLFTEELYITGQRIIDTFFPLVLGGTATIPGGFGTGKTITLQQIAKWSYVDVIIYIGCGERGNEMAEVLKDFPNLTDPYSQKPLMNRTILIVNTSNMPVSAREASIYTGISIAEYIRDMGYNVALMADSISRWAEALREISGRLNEIPAERGYPSYLPSRLAEFFERAGKVELLGSKNKEVRIGSVSVMGAVSPPAADFSDPVVQNAKRVVDVFWALDKDLAFQRHFPAINWTQSYSEYIEVVKDWWITNIDTAWEKYRNEAMELLKKDDELRRMVKLIGPDALSDSQKLILHIVDLIKEGFLNQNAFDKIDTFTTPEKQFEMLKLIIDFYHLSLDVIKKRIPIYLLLELPIIPKLFRIKSTIPNNALNEFDKYHKEVEKEISDLIAYKVV
ncbi:MAG: V-type ATP synthase subunit A [Candidatus Helarchaeota archaeon]